MNGKSRIKRTGATQKTHPFLHNNNATAVVYFNAKCSHRGAFYLMVLYGSGRVHDRGTKMPHCLALPHLLLLLVAACPAQQAERQTQTKNAVHESSLWCRVLPDMIR